MKVSTIGFQELGIVLNSVDCRGGGDKKIFDYLGGLH